MPLTQQIYSLVILSLAVAAVAWTVTQEEIFSELRKFFYLFTCEYCFSFWVGLAVIIFADFRLLLDDWRGYVIAYFVLPWIANQWMSLYRRLRVVIKYENALAENEKEEAGK
jgi:hypothetical protein